VDELPERHSYGRVPYETAGLRGRFGVTFSGMGRGYRGDPIFFDDPAFVERDDRPGGAT
jgi:hypothetical protein